MQQIILQADIGQDLTTINLLLSKHKTLETEILSHKSALQVSISRGNELINQRHIGSEKTRERIQNVTVWTHLIGLTNDRKKKRTDVTDFCFNGVLWAIGRIQNTIGGSLPEYLTI